MSGLTYEQGKSLSRIADALERIATALEKPTATGIQRGDEVTYVVPDDQSKRIPCVVEYSDSDSDILTLAVKEPEKWMGQRVILASLRDIEP